MICSRLLLCQLLNLSKENWMWNLLNILRDALANKKVEKIQLVGQKEAFYRGDEFAYPHCKYRQSFYVGNLGTIKNEEAILTHLIVQTFFLWMVQVKWKVVYVLSIMKCVILHSNHVLITASKIDYCPTPATYPTLLGNAIDNIQLYKRSITNFAGRCPAK